MIEVVQGEAGRQRLKEAIAESGGRVHVAVHPYMFHEPGDWADRGIPAALQRRMDEWVLGTRESRIPLILMLQGNDVERIPEKLAELDARRRIFVINAGPKPAEALGGWGFFKDLGIRKAFVGGLMSRYQLPRVFSVGPRLSAARGSRLWWRQVRKGAQKLTGLWFFPPTLARVANEEPALAEGVRRIRRAREKHAKAGGWTRRRMDRWAKKQLLIHTGCVAATLENLRARGLDAVFLPGFSGPHTEKNQDQLIRTVRFRE